MSNYSVHEESNVGCFSILPDRVNDHVSDEMTE